jgi:rhamnosyltransferase subunit B
MPEKFTAERVAPMVGNMLQKAKRSKALRHYAADLNKSNAIVNACDLIEQAGESGEMKSAKFNEAITVHS